MIKSLMQNPKKHKTFLTVHLNCQDFYCKKLCEYAIITGDFMYYTYILRCCDNTLYTGIALDIEKRMNEHFLQNEKCAKYTRTHKAKNSNRCG